MGDEGRVAPATAHAMFVHLFVPGACCTSCAHLVLAVPPVPILCLFIPPRLFIPPHSPRTRSCSFVLSLVLIYTHLHLFGSPTLPSYLAAIVIAVATAAPAAAATPAVIVIVIAAAAAPAASCCCCCCMYTCALAGPLVCVHLPSVLFVVPQHHHLPVIV